MALTFPVPLAQFWDELGRFGTSEAWYLDDDSAVEQTGGGEIIPFRVGTRLWRAEVAPIDRLLSETRSALTALIRNPAASFLAYDPARPGPLLDPSGAALSGFSPVIASLPAGNREVSLSGLPAGYVLSPDDYLAWTYGADPVRYALHQIVSGGTANGSGVTPAMEIVPNVRPGVVTGAAVTLVKAAAKFVFEPQSHAPGRTRGAWRSGTKFQIIQTLR